MLNLKVQFFLIPILTKKSYLVILSALLGKFIYLSLNVDVFDKSNIPFPSFCPDVEDWPVSSRLKPPVPVALALNHGVAITTGKPKYCSSAIYFIWTITSFELSDGAFDIFSNCNKTLSPIAPFALPCPNELLLEYLNVV